MQKYILIGFLLAPSLLFGMEKQADTIAGKLKLILTSGTRYVYSEHLSLHADAKRRAKSILACYKKEDRESLAREVASYASMLGRVAVTYKAHAALQDKDIVEALDTCHQRVLQWAEVLDTQEELSNISWIEFKCVFQSKLNDADLYAKRATRVRNSFEQKGGDTLCVLPMTTAIGAWFVRLPKPK